MQVIALNLRNSLEFTYVQDFQTHLFSNKAFNKGRYEAGKMWLESANMFFMNEVTSHNCRIG